MSDSISKVAEKWMSKPKGWTDESRKKFWESLTGDAKHKVTACMKKMEGKVDNPGAFCAALADRVLGTTEWRGKRKKAMAPINPRALAAAKKWAAKLTPQQRRKAGELAQRIRRTGLSTGMFEDFKKLGIRSMNMEVFLRLGQMPKQRSDELEAQIVQMLEMGAEHAKAAKTSGKRLTRKEVTLVREYDAVDQEQKQIEKQTPPPTYHERDKRERKRRSLVDRKNEIIRELGTKHLSEMWALVERVRKGVFSWPPVGGPAQRTPKPKLRKLTPKEEALVREYDAVDREQTRIEKQTPPPTYHERDKRERKRRSLVDRKNEIIRELGTENLSEMWALVERVVGVKPTLQPLKTRVKRPRPSRRKTPARDLTPKEESLVREYDKLDQEVKSLQRKRPRTLREQTKWETYRISLIKRQNRIIKQMTGGDLSEMWDLIHQVTGK